MFSKKDRLSREDFPIALKTGRRRSSPHFLILFPEGVRGYAVVIPKKIVRLSSARHLLKRQIIEAIRSLPLPASLVIFPRSSVRGVHYEDIQAELSTLIAQNRA